jgi:glycosyltransferase involved in cell wall biosynthesis
MIKKHPASKDIAFIIGTYPFRTTTFIDREILELKRKGLRIYIISIRRPIHKISCKNVKKLEEGTHYLLPVKYASLLKASGFFFITRPFSCFSTLLYLISRKQENFFKRVKTIFYFFEGILAANQLKKMRVKHIHAHFADRSTIVALVASRLLKMPYSFTAHANDIYVKPTMLKEKIENAKFVTTCTKYNKKYLEKITKKKVELIYHGLDLNIFKNNYRKQKNNLNFIISVGQLKEKKGFEYLIKACRILNKEKINFYCEIIGEGPEKEKLNSLIEKYKLKNHIKLLGALQHEEVIIKLCKATVFVLPCVLAKNFDRDGIPNVILEAMAIKLPVVSTNFSGIPEVIKNMYNGLLVKSRNEIDLAKGIKIILNNKNLIEQFGKRGRLTVEEKFDIKKNIIPYIELFKKA